ncbi:FadR/GntR family transcriptional regulator [Streptomyces colonosanans]|uniref:GntR family transcriptional regulator n=1 Tax=Streptomyces colonosanans TaxID=1428652 RepID=A0A1S2PHI0_9ACTN|nr:FadR/GntR family transcriptional regulator [Streptomyces colonosanans]OIJ92464.1 GntR family transcriptional regulator [Streptomyces colonosanans]
MTVTDEAIEKIKGMIVSGVLRPGGRLPKESQLAAELGLSRNSLREAVRALALFRILDVRQGDGTYVTSLDPQLLLEALNFVVDFHRDDTALEFLAVRRILEPAATALAASRISERQLDALAARLDELGPEPSVEELIACDLEFHRGIARNSGNSVLCSLLEGLSGPTTRAGIRRGPTREDAVSRTLYEHRAILGALRDRDAEAARSWATVHIASVEQWLRSPPSDPSEVWRVRGPETGA